MSAPADQGVPVTSLNIQQIMNLKKQFEEELTQLQATITLTNETVLKTQQAKNELKQFTAVETGKTMLVPITESLYVTGTVSSQKRPIIELGTGYFAETSVEKAEAFFNRRLKRLNAQQENLRNSFKEKQQQYQMVVQVANQKIQATQQKH
ncbi:coiled-coil protein, putative [Trichomonas vaginalis G3]|uniref:Coiled-coil protein, putative n=1 Tax=Trichomonas vaginalis (strain ATCC PRA-98 / G3) TaxID=412133 RepID=A2E1M0_TRIV3|nr:prefoldin subunit family [Trichomonas vaginalis G3]EAY13467.1 coiled-coil protein, putative [Trichomonas vaginalis G3]KAI5518338.1 prefoldin subunit family [Trichomonas vaginalis G3]|eukprot:XP_001325690.1 coiled-coil protein [Trichomonas vaginalis G3]